MSSHREAPEISKDPVADNADVYAFVSPDQPGTVTIIANFVPLQGPAGGPNFYEFGDDVLYSIYIDNDGDAEPDIEYQFQFNSTLQNPNTFLYNTGPGHVARRARAGTRRQFYSVTRIDSGKAPKHGNGNADARPGVGEGQAVLDPARHEPAVPAVQRRPALDARTTPSLASAAIQTLPVRREGVLRAAERPVLRRPRVDLRPRRAAAVQRPPT